MINRSIFVLFCSCLLSCDALNPFEAEGEYTKKVFEPGEILNVRNNNNFKIVLVKDDSDYLILKGRENKINGCELSYENGSVSLNHNYKNKLRNFELIIAEVHSSNLNTITINAPAEINSVNVLEGDNLHIDVTSKAELVELSLKLNFESLKFHSHGSVSGGFHFSGNCNVANYTMNGITNILASDLQCQKVRIGQNGIGDAHVWCEQSLYVTIYNSGNIYCKGTPEVSVNYVKVNNQNATGEIISK
ncbi:GIN domain-containing protein [Marinifilum sp.]|uniref:GIN domain-containing protein n=1 Tax=Marinifilum sp. TaxID=2033137 RepID=UPI003BAB1B8C